jgi:aerobic C4-dicarboxylate transport protein
METHNTTEVAYRPFHVKKRWYQQLYFYVLLAIIIGVLLGWLSPSAGVAMEPIGTTLVNAMKMLIGPISSPTIVSGIPVSRI